MKFTLSTVSEIASPGQTTRAGVRVRKSLPSNSSRPQVGKSDVRKTVNKVEGTEFQLKLVRQTPHWLLTAR